MKVKRYTLDILDIIPQQHYLSTQKYDQVKRYMEKTKDYGNIFVIEYKRKFFSVDGHHRLFVLFEKGVREINVVCEASDNDNRLYQILADESLELGIRHIGDLKDRFLDDDREYEEKWIEKCQKIQVELEKGVSSLASLRKNEI